MNTRPPLSSCSSSPGAGVAVAPSLRLMPASLWRPVFSALTAASMAPVMIIWVTRRCPVLLPAIVMLRSSVTSSAVTWAAIWASVRPANLSLMLVRYQPRYPARVCGWASSAGDMMNAPAAGPNSSLPAFGSTYVLPWARLPLVSSS